MAFPAAENSSLLSVIVERDTLASGWKEFWRFEEAVLTDVRGKLRFEIILLSYNLQAKLLHFSATTLLVVPQVLSSYVLNVFSLRFSSTVLLLKFFASVVMLAS